MIKQAMPRHEGEEIADHDSRILNTMYET